MVECWRLPFKLNGPGSLLEGLGTVYIGTGRLLEGLGDGTHRMALPLGLGVHSNIQSHKLSNVLFEHSPFISCKLCLIPTLHVLLLQIALNTIGSGMIWESILVNIYIYCIYCKTAWLSSWKEAKVLKDGVFKKVLLTELGKQWLIDYYVNETQLEDMFPVIFINLFVSGFLTPFPNYFHIGSSFTAGSLVTMEIKTCIKCDRRKMQIAFGMRILP